MMCQIQGEVSSIRDSGLFILSHNNTIKSAGLFITNRTEGISGQVLHQLCAE